jgi:hypothetical protein
MHRRTKTECFILVAAILGIVFAVGFKALGGAGATGSVYAGAAFGVVMGAIAAPKMEEIEVTRDVEDSSTAIASLETKLAEMDVFPKTAVGPIRVYESEAAGSFSLPGGISVPGFTNRVRVRADANRLTIVGPRSVVSKL